MSTWNDARAYVNTIESSRAPSVQSDVRSLLAICNDLQRLGNSPTNFLRAHASTLRRAIPVLWPLIEDRNIATIEVVMRDAAEMTLMQFIRTYGLRQYEEVAVHNNDGNVQIEMTPAQFYRIQHHLTRVFDLRTA